MKAEEKLKENGESIDYFENLRKNSLPSKKGRGRAKAFMT
jgi:hypothetical protein